MISAPILPHAITLHFAIRLNTNVSHPNHICISWHHSADDTKDLKEKLKNKDAEIANLNKRVREKQTVAMEEMPSMGKDFDYNQIESVKLEIVNNETWRSI